MYNDHVTNLDRSGGVAWQHVGGHPVLELADTISWRFDPPRRRDLLSTAIDLWDWATHFLPATPWPRDAVTDRTLSRVRTIRGHVIAILDAHADERPLRPEPSRALFAAASRYLSDAEGADDLPLEPRHVPIHEATLPDLLAERSLTLLRSPHVDRIRRCAAPDCGWFFLDQTKNHSRRWCQGSGCGNRARTRRYTARHH